ncbi:hypothetical protein GGI20_001972 [Coemansia sp. BCRC 34301]|nr:hypothetical protein GGI20_001972 [Coemansia sp. BCRC 34301]
MVNYQVVRCSSDDCAKFQSQQEKKTNKWACVVCGLRQSVRRVYFQSTAPKECRHAVMELNMNHGLAESARLSHASQSYQSFSGKDGDDPDASQDMATRHPRDVEQGAQTESKWATYAEAVEDTSEKPDDDAHDLDQFNRVVIGRVEQSETRKQAITKTMQRKALTPRVPPRNVAASLSISRPAQQQRPAPVKHMPYKRPELHADPQATDKSSLLQALASVAKRGHPGNQPATIPASHHDSDSIKLLAGFNPRSKPAATVETQDKDECAGASKWSQFDSNDSDTDSNTDNS